VITEEDIREALLECYDPEIPVNIVDLGLIYDIDIQHETPHEAKVAVTMTLTAPGCGMGPSIAREVRERLLLVPGVKDAVVNLTFEPFWNPGMMSDEAKKMLGMP